MLAALQSYAAGTDAWTKRRFEEAIARLRRAVELDSTFALAWLGLAEASFQLERDRTAANAALAQAMRYAGRLTERERLRLEQASLGYSGRVDQQLHVAQRLAQRFPTATRGTPWAHSSCACEGVRTRSRHSDDR